MYSSRRWSGLTITYESATSAKTTSAWRYGLDLDSHCMHCIVTGTHRGRRLLRFPCAPAPWVYGLHTMLLGTAYGLYGGPTTDGTLWMKQQQTGYEYAGGAA